MNLHHNFVKVKDFDKVYNINNQSLNQQINKLTNETIIYHYCIMFS